MKMKTVYYAPRGRELKSNYSTDANRAVELAVRHMQVNHYGARVAQVSEAETGIMHAEVKLSADGSLRITYKRDPRAFENRFAFDAILKEE